MRVLHLVHPPSTGDAALRRLRLLLDAELATHGVLVVGGSRDEDRVHRLGINTWDRLSPPLRRPELAALTLRRFLRVRRFDLLHAWSPSCMAMAWLARPGLPLVTTLGLPPETRRALIGTRLLRAAARYSTLCFPGPWTRDAWFARLGITPPHHLVPNAFVDADAATRRDTLRAEWGIADGTIVILTGGDPIERQPSRLLMYVAALSVYAGQPAAVVLSTGARDMERTRRFDVNFGGPWQLIFDDRPREDLLVGADVALWDHATSGVGATAAPVGIDRLEHAAVRGVPIVAGEHPLLDELRESCEARPHAERPLIDLIQQILQLQKDPEGVARQSAMMQTSARERHDPARWLAAYRELYAAAS
ncbi:MAG: glycosyltransferase [Phycisphaerales bacterium]|nr:glycosyltransferase [Phycisphaerales bacterium]